MRLAVVNGFLTLMTMVLIVVDVAGRAFLNRPLRGGNELAVLFLVSLVYLGMAAAQKERHHFSIDLVRGRLPERARRVLDTITGAIAAALIGFLTWLAADLAWTSTLSGEASYGIVSFPVWPSRILIAVGLFCLTVQFLFDFLRNLGALPHHEADHCDADGGAD